MVMNPTKYIADRITNAKMRIKDPGTLNNIRNVMDKRGMADKVRMITDPAVDSRAKIDAAVELYIDGLSKSGASNAQTTNLVRTIKDQYEKGNWSEKEVAIFDKIARERADKEIYRYQVQGKNSQGEFTMNPVEGNDTKIRQRLGGNSFEGSDTSDLGSLSDIVAKNRSEMYDSYNPNFDIKEQFDAMKKKYPDMDDTELHEMLLNNYSKFATPFAEKGQAQANQAIEELRNNYDQKVAKSYNQGINENLDVMMDRAEKQANKAAGKEMDNIYTYNPNEILEDADNMVYSGKANTLEDAIDMVDENKRKELVGDVAATNEDLESRLNNYNPDDEEQVALNMTSRGNGIYDKILNEQIANEKQRALNKAEHINSQAGDSMQYRHEEEVPTRETLNDRIANEEPENRVLPDPIKDQEVADKSYHRNNMKNAYKSSDRFSKNADLLRSQRESHGEYKKYLDDPYEDVENKGGRYVNARTNWYNFLDDIKQSIEKTNGDPEAMNVVKKGLANVFGKENVESIIDEAMADTGEFSKEYMGRSLEAKGNKLKGLYQDREGWEKQHTINEKLKGRTPQEKKAYNAAVVRNSPNNAQNFIEMGRLTKDPSDKGWTREYMAKLGFKNAYNMDPKTLAEMYKKVQQQEKDLPEKIKNTEVSYNRLNKNAKYRHDNPDVNEKGIPMDRDTVNLDEAVRMMNKHGNYTTKEDLIKQLIEMALNNN